MSSEEKRGRLPFEPRQNKKKTPKKDPAKVDNKSTKIAQGSERKSKNQKGSKSRQVDPEDGSLSAIPDVVSKRMARRMALFCGIPTTLGVSSFFIFYWLSSNQWLILPPYIVLFVSFSLFGLGFVGLSYGIFSTSWDETQAGSWLGSEQVSLNWQRTTDAWKTSRKSTKEN